MRYFSYQALTSEEELRTGTITATSAAAALAELEAQGLTVLLVRQVDKPEEASPVEAVAAAPVSLSHAEEIVRSRVGEFLEERELLGPALAAFAEELPAGQTKREMRKLTTKIQQGATVEELTPNVTLTRVWLPLVGNGSNFRSRFLQDVLVEANREANNRAELRKNLAYPLAVLALALLVALMISIFIVPIFEAIYNDFRLDLPRISLMVIGISRLIRLETLKFLAIVALVLFGGYVVQRILRNVILPSRGMGELIGGNTQQVREMANFTRRLAEALNVGVPLPDALQLVGENSRHRWLKRESSRLASELASASHPEEVLSRSYLPATVAHALHLGPQGTPHLHLLQTLADAYTERVNNRFNWATGFMPQVMILIVGIIVGTVVVGLFIPLVELINGLTG